MPYEADLDAWFETGGLGTPHNMAVPLDALFKDDGASQHGLLHAGF